MTCLPLRLSQDEGLLPVALGDEKQAPGVKGGLPGPPGVPGAGAAAPELPELDRRCEGHGTGPSMQSPPRGSPGKPATPGRHILAPVCHQTAGEGLLTIPEVFRDIQWVACRGRCSRVPLEDTLRSVFANTSICGLSKQRRDSSVRDHDWCDGFRGRLFRRSSVI